MTMGIVLASHLLRRAGIPPATGNDDVNFQPHEFGWERAQAIAIAVRESLLDDHVFTLNVAEIAQALLECFGVRRNDRAAG